MDFQVGLKLHLPRDRHSVPLARHLAGRALYEVGAHHSDAHDVELALAEACTNVLTHAGPGDAYDVDVAIGPSQCVISVIDLGRGFDVDNLPEKPDADAEGGRGLDIMRKLMDSVRLVTRPDGGTVVQLVKNLRFAAEAP
ncbi:MAG TPA: ATP-binding protein [Acidimicrobiales bacterium]|nr:ATP-binding protein [Acidimicrobiales bacterium]